ncbi:cobyrinate a,c-diamide synthase [Pelotomaculum propionicicum]|uniref:Cobyrinate a,c-diamide synthase n=1 Tax=Pelotomaculum propionicicum TaxID=258475 RepID=A0A4Y7RNA4_9FIRM|nr:cobyrinate a,c-diamide synthase [Pelotomaculum propionicicum]TEB10343.1 Cobyrinate a,c-diamide synthase [Pelotomaculum propionicicum]
MGKLTNMPRLVIAAPQGRSGKTTISVGLMSGLTAKGFTVQPFKKGPDYIDPSWLTMVTGRQCCNLDSFMMGREALQQSFLKYARSADISIVEGAMGIFDGVDLAGSGSTGEVAKAINAPVILVVDTTRMTRSVAAMVMGFQHFDPDLVIAGVILNNVARPRHESMLRSSVEHYCGIPVLGAMPKNNALKIPNRHLGLIPANETASLHAVLEEVKTTAIKHLDLEKLVEIARSAPPVLVNDEIKSGKETYKLHSRKEKPVIGIFKDQSFTFYYRENLEALEGAGAELLYIDSLNDPELPDVDALYIGGGFPELFAAELEKNKSLRGAVKAKVEENLPVYAECGGLMYLGRSLIWRDQTYQMCGVLPFDVIMSDKPQGHGYVELEVSGENPYFNVGEVIRGHEFHHSRLINLEPGQAGVAYNVKRGTGMGDGIDGLVYKNVMASYTHLHAVSVPQWARNLVSQAENYRMRSSQLEEKAVLAETA